MVSSIRKPVVQYERGSSFVELHCRALVKPIHLPSRRVSDLGLSLTSSVISIEKDEDGNILGFETENTIYKKAAPQ